MITFFVVGVLLAGIVQADIPAKEEVYTIHTFGGSDPKNYVSNNFIYSALPFYHELPAGTTTPWKKYRHEQRGVIVTNDRRVYYFPTQDPVYLSITDEENRSFGLHLVKSPSEISKVPQHHGLSSDLQLTKNNLFCVSSVVATGTSSSMVWCSVPIAGVFSVVSYASCERRIGSFCGAFLFGLVHWAAFSIGLRLIPGYQTWWIGPIISRFTFCITTPTRIFDFPDCGI